MIFVVRQVKNHVTLPQELVLDRFSLLNALEQVCGMGWALHVGRHFCRLRWQNRQYEGHFYGLLFVHFNWNWREIENCTVKKGN